MKFFQILKLTILNFLPITSNSFIELYLVTISLNINYYIKKFDFIGNDVSN